MVGDVFDETFVLAGHRPNDATSVTERILDDELHRWFSMADQKGINVVFVADSCHSGTVHRGGKTRSVLEDPFAGYDEVSDLKLVKDRPIVIENPLPNVVFVAGSTQDDPVVEQRIFDKQHGALSVAFANALNMHGDRNQDNVLSRNELSDYLSATVPTLNEGRTIPSVVARDGEDFSVLVRETPVRTEPIEVHAGFDFFEASEFVELPIGGLVWERESGTVRDPQSQIVATDVNLADLPQVVDKFRLIDVVTQGVLRSGFNMRVEQDGAPVTRKLAEGEIADLNIGPVPKAYLTMFNLSNIGVVSSVYPLTADQRKRGLKGETRSIKIQVKPPFGADHLVAVATNQEPKDLRYALRWALPARDVEEILLRMAAVSEVSFGLLGVFSDQSQ